LLKQKRLERRKLTMPIKVSRAVLDGITAVRDSGKTNMLDRNSVAKLCSDMGYYEAALWVNDNKKEYAEGIFNGFEVEVAEGRGDVL
jgi:hypothetical protein